MMAIVRNRRGIITGVEPYPPEPGPEGRVHLVHLEYTDANGTSADTLVWEREPGARLLEPTALPDISNESPMLAREFDAMVRAARWTALTPTLPFTGHADDLPPVASPFFGAVQVEDYQLVPLLRALRMPRVAILLADAVGLGKTIECGLILKELMLRRRLRRILILCPAALRRQWKQEMADKFALDFEIIDRKETTAIQKRLGLDANPWRAHEKIITSFQYLRQHDVREQFRAAAQPGDDGQLGWDLLIVDEAHNLSPSNFGQDSELSRMLRTISPFFEHRVFLTATPHNGHTRCFTGLLEALDPVRFTRTSELSADEKRRVEQVVVRRLKREINARTNPPRFSERFVKALPDLAFTPAESTLNRAFVDFRRAVRSLVASSQKSDQLAGTFAVEVLGKRLLSGPATFAQSWWRCVQGLDAEHLATPLDVRDAHAAADVELDDDAELESRVDLAAQVVGAWLKPMAKALAGPISDLNDALCDLGLPTGNGLIPKADARYTELKTWIDANLRDGNTWKSDERLIVFTEYKTTLDYLATRLKHDYRTGDADTIRVLYGGMSDDERQAIKDAFNDPEDPLRILVATDAASEGLNLQETSRYLLHWDIPWNPSRMEQRNGRLDRHGQARDVFIMHFTSSDDVSLRFMGKLLEKRSQIRDDRVSADQIFSDAIEAHFMGDVDADALEKSLDAAISNATMTDDLPASDPTETGEAQKAELEKLAVALDFTPETLRETLEVALGNDALEGPDARGRFRLRTTPASWRMLVDDSLRRAGAMPGMVFDPARFVRNLNGRPIFRPSKDSALIHLGHPMIQRAISTFARARFQGDPNARPSRWIVRRGPVPEGAQALVLLTVEQLAVNELREPCHHWVATHAFPVLNGALGERIDVQKTPPQVTAIDSTLVDDAREIWDEVDTALKAQVKAMALTLTGTVRHDLEVAGKHALEQETARFQQRLAEVKGSLSKNSLASLERERDALLDKINRQSALFVEIDREREKKLQDLNAELELRKSHYEELRQQLEEERDRLIKRILPLRYRLREGAQVFPITVEIRFPEVHA
jgi:superfamily II DNA or RNA helicase